MTETLGQPSSFSVFLKRFVAFMGRAGFGLFVVAAIAIALVATTFIGLMLAVAAGFLTLAYHLGRGSRSGRQPDDPNTLDAHRTPDGWVIERHGANWR
ncbi:MAG: hypothetical protein GC155_00275 [Alphaproteobacteria bacterium]|nr:hypothetical protein [Alphaproteobacteria bacterium]